MAAQTSDDQARREWRESPGRAKALAGENRNGGEGSRFSENGCSLSPSRLALSPGLISMRAYSMSALQTSMPTLGISALGGKANIPASTTRQVSLQFSQRGFFPRRSYDSMPSME